VRTQPPTYPGILQDIKEKVLESYKNSEIATKDFMDALKSFKEAAKNANPDDKEKQIINLVTKTRRHKIKQVADIDKLNKANDIEDSTINATELKTLGITNPDGSELDQSQVDAINEAITDSSSDDVTNNPKALQELANSVKALQESNDSDTNTVSEEDLNNLGVDVPVDCV